MARGVTIGRLRPSQNEEGEMVKLNKLKYALCVFAVGTICQAQSAVDRLQPLVETAARRLAIADQVALAKADSGAEVEDIAREKVVIANAVKEGEAKGLGQEEVTKFFVAQIEANKIVQYSLLADWRRTGSVPPHEKVDLAKTIRPQLDQVQTALIAELADTAEIRSSSTCWVDIAKAAAKYLSSHPQDHQALHTIALDRALAAACTPSK
jgi:chorismate mutase